MQAEPGCSPTAAGRVGETSPGHLHGALHSAPAMGQTSPGHLHGKGTLLGSPCTVSLPWCKPAQGHLPGIGTMLGSPCAVPLPQTPIWSLAVPPKPSTATSTHLSPPCSSLMDLLGSHLGSPEVPHTGYPQQTCSCRAWHSWCSWSSPGSGDRGIWLGRAAGGEFLGSAPSVQHSREEGSAPAPLCHGPGWQQSARTAAKQIWGW